MLHMDTNILQTKTACNIISVLKLARTITKSGSSRFNRINKMIEGVIKQHHKAISKKRVGKRPEIPPYWKL